MRRRKSCWSASNLALALALLAGPLAAQAETVAKAVFVQGVVSAQAKDAAPRLLGKDAPLNVDDTVTTGTKSFVILEFIDGAKTTLRPDSVFSVEAYVQKEGKESISLNLLKGGLRTITGAIGKRKPESYQLRTPVATIGIRGTEFDARLCAADCAAEAAQQSPAARAPESPATAAATGLKQALVQSLIAAPGAPAPPGLYVSVTSGRVAVATLAAPGAPIPGLPRPPGIVTPPTGPAGIPVVPRPPTPVEVRAGRAAFVDAGTLKATPLAQPPVFMKNDPYPQPGRVDTNTLQLWNVIKGNDDAKKDNQPAGCPTP